MFARAVAIGLIGYIRTIRRCFRIQTRFAPTRADTRVCPYRKANHVRHLRITPLKTTACREFRAIFINPLPPSTSSARDLRCEPELAADRVARHPTPITPAPITPAPGWRGDKAECKQWLRITGKYLTIAIFTHDPLLLNPAAPMKPVVLLFLLLFVSASAKAQPKPTTLLDSLLIAANNGTYPNLEGITISQGGMHTEAYFHGFTKDSLHDTRSAFKSVTGLLIGIAIDKGFVKSVNEKVYAFFPEYKPYQNWTGVKDSMTIAHLLAMKSGFDCEEWEGAKDCEDEMSLTHDWIRFCLDLPLKNKPGTQWDYTSINAMLLGGILAHATHMSVTEFADRYLFKPLGITRYRWTQDPAGHEMTAGSFYLSPRDMNKIGQLVLHDGVYQNTRIVSQQWIQAMTRPLTKIENFSNVQISKNKTATPQPTYYGYTWYNEKIQTPRFTYNVVFASGNGGQYIMVIKDLDLVVTFTGNSYQSWKSKLPFDILIHYILPHFARN